MTAATWPQTSGYDDVVDLSRYPINDPADPAYRALVQAAQDHIRNGDPAPADLSDAQKCAYGQVAFATYHRGYGVIQGIRSQTIGYSLLCNKLHLARPGTIVPRQPYSALASTTLPGWHRYRSS